MVDLANPNLADPDLDDPNLADPDLGGGALLVLADGTFSRSSDAYALGSDSLLDQYAANELRTEYRSDLGLYLLEGERTNRVAHYRDPTQWTVTGATTDSTTEDDMLGSNLAGQYSGTTGDTIEFPLATQPADSTTVSAAVWVRGSGTVRIRIRAKDGTFVNGADVTLTSSYQRIDVQGSTLTGATNVLPGVEIRAAGTTVDVSGPHLEDGAYPSSDIVTDGTAATRAADALTFATSEVPERMKSGKWAFDVRPRFAHNEWSGQQTLFQFGQNADSDFVRVRFVASPSIRIDVFDQSIPGIAVQSRILSWSRHTVITVTLDPAAGSITIEGADSGNGTNTGTAWTEPSDTLYVADDNGSATHFYGGLSDVRKG